MYVRLGHNLKKNLSKINVDDYKECQMSELRKDFGLFKKDLIEIWKVEVLEFGVNTRMLDGLTVNVKELAILEERTEEIIIYSPDLKNDLLETTIMKTVANNLEKGIKYKYLLPKTKENKKRKNQLIELHKNNTNLSVVLISEEDYYKKYNKNKEYVFYDNLIYVTEDKPNIFTIHTI